MPKQKTHKGIAKRLKVSARGKIKRKSAFKGHLLSAKTGKRRRMLRKTKGMSATMTRKTLMALGH